MKLLKPDWVSHDEKPIFSIDIHPAGLRFATGGQGGDSGRVVIWNLNAVLQESVELDSSAPKMLCQMDNHLACVNCVRWSCGGNYLASGGDDKLVMVWRMSGTGSSTVFGGSGKMNVESWRCIATLRGHAGDVLDLAWSPLDKWLASCSVDNSIIVWNAEKFPEMICVLSGHSGLVKGVSWDPVGKYLASQSDDKSLRIWKTVDWTQEAVVTEPFEECGGTTHVLRLSWSPDGQYVISAHAMNGGGPTAQIVERDGWRCDKDFVGHRKAVTCVRFNSNILGRWMEGGRRGSQYYCCAAIGSRDRSLSVWCTSLKRPLVVVHELFTDSVLDLSWSKDGLNLLACSWDGTVACIQFSKKEIGLPLTNQEKNTLYERMYGKPIACLADQDISSATLLIESPEILKLREEQEKKEQAKSITQSSTSPEAKVKPVNTDSEDKVINNSINAIPSLNTNSSPLRPINRQIETRTSDGKRRITPMFIPLHHPTDQNDTFTNATSTDGCFSSSSQAKSKIIVEKRDDIIIAPNVSNHASVLTPCSTGPNTFIGVTKPTAENELDSRLKRKADALPGPKVNDVTKKHKSSPTKNKTDNNSLKNVMAFDIGGTLAKPTLGTAGPIVRQAGKFRVQILNNDCNTPHGKLTKVQLLPGNSATSDPVWQNFLGSPCSSIACDGKWICIGCEDATLHIMETNTGKKLVGTLALGAPAARLSLVTLHTGKVGTYLCAITTAAVLTVWNMQQCLCVVQPLSLRYLMLDGVNVSSLGLTDECSPTVSLTNGKGYIYSYKMSSWILGCDGNDPLWKCARNGYGRFSNSLPPAGSTPLSTLYQNTLRGRQSSSQHQSHYQQGYHSGAIQSYLESQLASSLLLESPMEYKHWLLALISHLLIQGPEVKLRNILDDFMGPSHCTSASKQWNDTVLGISKHSLLDDILVLLGKHLNWQRLYIEYSEQVAIIKETKNLKDA